MSTIEYDPSKVSKEYLEGILAYHHNSFDTEDEGMELDPYEIGTVESASWVNGYISQINSKAPFYNEAPDPRKSKNCQNCIWITKDNKITTFGRLNKLNQPLIDQMEIIKEFGEKAAKKKCNLFLYDCINKVFLYQYKQ